MPVLEAIDVFPVRSTGTLQSSATNPFAGLGNLGFRQNRSINRADVLDEIRTGAYLIRHLGLESAITRENDDRLERIKWKAKQRLERLDVSVVLPKRILEPGP